MEKPARKSKPIKGSQNSINYDKSLYTAIPQHKSKIETDVKHVKRNYWPLLGELEHHLGHEIPRYRKTTRYLDELQAVNLCA